MKRWFLLFCTISSFLYGEVGRGGYAGNFFRMGLGASAWGVGGGSSALVENGYIAYVNPAGAALLSKHYVAFSMESMALDRERFWVGYAQPITREFSSDSGAISSRKAPPFKAGFAIGWLGAGITQIDGRDFDGLHTGMLSSWEHALYFCFAVAPHSRLAFGVGSKILYQRLGNVTESGQAVTAKGFGFDLGMLWKPSTHLEMGFSLHDFNSRYTWNTQKYYEQGPQTTDRFPRMFRIGGVWKTYGQRLWCIGQLEKIEFFPWHGNGGVQFEFQPGMALRTGWSPQGWTLGFGFHRTIFSKNTGFDYAFVSDTITPRGTHVFSWEFAF